MRAALASLAALAALALLALAPAAFAQPQPLAGGFDSGLLKPGEAWAFRFDAPGELGYYCVPHPVSMQANLTVARGAPARNVTVDLVDFAIEPKSLTVGVGSVVTFRNFADRSFTDHTATQSSGEPAVGVEVQVPQGPAPKRTPAPAALYLVGAALVAAALLARP